MADKKKLVTKEDIMQMLDSCYTKSLDGIPMVSPTIEKMANDYLKKYTSEDKAIKAMFKNQIIKCTTSGFITGFGGFITIPVAIPANIGSVIYVQMRMIACCAYMKGYDLKDDHTQTFVYACLAGVALNNTLKQTGVKLGVKMTQSLINKIPGKVLFKINEKVGFRFITKAGTKGIINIGKMVPGAGAVISGAFDLAETKAIAKRAYKWFCKGDFTGDEEDSGKDELIIDIDDKNDDELIFDIDDGNLHV